MQHYGRCSAAAAHCPWAGPHYCNLARTSEHCLLARLLASTLLGVSSAILFAHDALILTRILTLCLAPAACVLAAHSSVLSRRANTPIEELYSWLTATLTVLSAATILGMHSFVNSACVCGCRPCP